VKELKSSYENLEEQFNATLKNAPDFSDGYMEVYSTDKSPTAYGSREYFILYDDYSTSYLANCEKTSEEAVAVMFAPVVGRQRLDRISGEKMLDTDTGTGGTTKDFAFGFLTFCTVFKYHSVYTSELIADTDTFSEKLEKILKLMDPENNIYYGNNAAACAGCYSTFVSIKANLTQLKLTWNSIIEQLKTVFNIDYTESRMTGTLDLPYIVDLQQYLIINMTETVYAKDSVIQTY